MVEKQRFCNLNVPVCHRAFPERRPLYKKLLFALITLLLYGLSMFQIGDRVSYYMSEPTTISYKSEILKAIRFPSITLCPIDGFNGPLIESEIVKRNVTSVYELLNVGLDLNDIWNLTWNAVWTNIIYFEYANRVFYKPTDWKAQYTFLGLCYTLDFPNPMVWSGKNDYFHLNFNDKMKHKLIVFFHDITADVSYVGATELRYIIMQYLTSTIIIFHSRITKYENVTRRPCYNHETYNCAIQCYDKEILLGKTCRLPFIAPDRSNLSLCSTPEDFQAAYPISNNNMRSTLLANAKQCKKKCGKLCINHQYDPQFGLANFPPKMTSVYLTPRGYSIKVVTERLAYQFESLMSDVGGTVGLYLGMSLLSVAELVEKTFFALFYNKG